MENRDHKLLRKRFAFGGGTVGKAGARIDPEKCIACGECYEARLVVARISHKHRVDLV